MTALGWDRRAVNGYTRKAQDSDYTCTMCTDDELVAGFESATLPAFPHGDHVRLTIIYLTRLGRDETLRKLYDGLRRFATAQGKPDKFHVTMTRAWVDLVESALRAHPHGEHPSALVTNCPELLDRDALLRFYTPERLNSPEARASWLPPDRSPVVSVNLQSKPAQDRSSETTRI
jgi:hypothetical protein